jgi:putative endonuclease
MKKPKPVWTLYILECADGSLYTGITNDVVKRMAAHECGKGAKYTRGRAPLKLVHTEVFKTRSKASIREAEIKSLTKTQKLALLKPAISQ